MGRVSLIFLRSPNHNAELLRIRRVDWPGLVSHRGRFSKGECLVFFAGRRWVKRGGVMELGRWVELFGGRTFSFTGGAFR